MSLYMYMLNFKVFLKANSILEHKHLINIIKYIQQCLCTFLLLPDLFPLVDKQDLAPFCFPSCICQLSAKPWKKMTI